MLNLHRIYKPIQLFLLMALTMTTAGCATGKKALYKIDFSGQKEFYCTEIAKGMPTKQREEHDMATFTVRSPKTGTAEGKR